MGAYLTFPDGVVSNLQTSTSLFFDIVESEDWDKMNQVTKHPVETGSDITDNVRVGLPTCQLAVFVTNEPLTANSFTSQTSSQTTITVPGPPTRTFPNSVTAKVWNNELNFQAALKGVGSIVGSTVGGQVGSVIGTAVGGIAGALLFAPGPQNQTVVPAGGFGVDAPQGYSISPALNTQGTTADYVRLMELALDQLRTTATLITVVGTKNSCPNMVITGYQLHRDAETGTGGEFTIHLEQLRFVSTQTVTAPNPAPTVARAAPKVDKGPQNGAPVPAALKRSQARALAIRAVSTGGGMYSPDQIDALELTPSDLGTIGGQ